MADAQIFLAQARGLAARVPMLGWAAAGVILVSLAVVFSLEMSGPPYVVLDDGLSPEDGGKVIAQLQKLGIPYQLQAAGNLILVPAPELAQARLQLGAATTPGGDAGAQWDRLENAPMTASDLAQDTMAAQALQATLAQSIESLNGIHAAQVYLALPPDTPFLADQPKPTASVIITADDDAGAAQGQAIANLVAGAVPGLSAQQVSVATTDGVTVYPAGKGVSTSSQLATIAAVENRADARVAQLLAPLVGEGNFRADVAAALDFTQSRTHQISYGPAQMVAHQKSAQTAQESSGSSGDLAIGIPGAMSNEPPAATTAAAPAAPGAQAAPAAPAAPGGGATGNAPASATGNAAAPAPPLQTSKTVDQTYLTDQSESDIVTPDWTVKSIAVSVVLNKAAIGALSPAQVKAAIAGAFADPRVSVNVLVAPFQVAGAILAPRPWLQDVGPVSGAVMEVLAAMMLLFGVALPVGRRLGNFSAVAPSQSLLGAARTAAVTLQPQSFADLREQAGENITSVARLLQNWADDGE